jgi:hypothetical protein
MARSVTLTQTNAGSTVWVGVNPNITPFNLSVSCHITFGSPTYTVEYSYQDVNYSPTSQFAYVVDNPSVTVVPDQNVTALDVDAVAVMTVPVRAVRVTVSGTGAVQATVLQAGIAGP